MTEIGRQERKLALGVDALPIPREHPVNDERVPQVVDPRTASSRLRLQAGRSDHPPQQVLGRQIDVPTLLVAEQRRRCLSRQSCLGALAEIVGKHRGDGWPDRHMARLEELGLMDLERLRGEIDIAEPEPGDLADA